jgi:hypothetical protein
MLFVELLVDFSLTSLNILMIFCVSVVGTELKLLIKLN